MSSIKLNPERLLMLPILILIANTLACPNKNRHLVRQNRIGFVRFHSNSHAFSSSDNGHVLDFFVKKQSKQKRVRSAGLARLYGNCLKFEAPEFIKKAANRNLNL